MFFWSQFRRPRMGWPQAGSQVEATVAILCSPRRYVSMQRWMGSESNGYYPCYRRRKPGEAVHQPGSRDGLHAHITTLSAWLHPNCASSRTGRLQALSAFCFLTQKFSI